MKNTLLAILLFCTASLHAASLTNIIVNKRGVNEASSVSFDKLASNTMTFSNVVADLVAGGGGGGGSINSTNPIFYESIRLISGTNLTPTNVIWIPDHTNTAGTNIPPVFPPIFIPGPGGTLTNTNGDVIITGPTNMPTGSPTVGMSNIVWLTNAGTSFVNGPYQRVPFSRWIGAPSELWLQLPLDVYPKGCIFVWTNGNAEVGVLSNKNAFGHIGKELKTATVTFTMASTANRSARADLNASIIFGPTAGGFSSPLTADLKPYLYRAKAGDTIKAFVQVASGPPFTHTDGYTVDFNATFVNGQVLAVNQSRGGYDPGAFPEDRFTNLLATTYAPDGSGPYYTRSDFYCNSSSWVTNGGIGSSSAPSQRFFYTQTNFCSGTPPTSTTGAGMNTNAGPTTVQVPTNSIGGMINGYLVYHPNSGDCTYFTQSALWISSVMSANHSGYGPNWITLDSAGTARLILIGITVNTIPQSDTTLWRPCRENGAITHDY